MRPCLSLWILLLDVTCCSGFGRNSRPPFENIFDGTDIRNAANLYNERMLHHRRTNRVATGDAEVSCSICLELGVPMKEDLIPLPNSAPNVTCAELEYFMIMPENKDICIDSADFLTKLCCDTGEMEIPLYKCVENIQTEKFVTMNKEVAPILFDRPLVVDAHLSFQALERIDVKLSTASMFVFLRLKWFDPRLAWNRTDTHCSTAMSMKASINRELTQIWVPDYDLLNRIRGVQTWSEVEAEVRFDGMVVWERSGVLEVGCTFKGLRKMPFDILGCQLFFGGFTQRHLIQYNANPGFDNETFTRSFQEYTMIPNLTKVFYTEPQFVEGIKYLDRHEVVYNFYFRRSSSFYVTKMIIPSILFTFVSFGLFLLDLRLGERLGFGLNILLVNVAQDIITNAFIPISEEKLWLVTFIQASTYWIFAALFETIFVSWIYYKAGKHVEDDEIYQHLNLNKDETTQIRNEGVENEPVSLKKGKEASKKQENLDEMNIENDSKPEGSKAHPANDMEIEYFENDDDKNIRSRSILKGQLDGEIEETEKKSFGFLRKIPELKPSESGNLQQTAEILIRPLMHLTTKERLVLINWIDRVCMMVYPTSYILFIIIMFATKDRYSESDEKWTAFTQSTSEL